MTTPVPEAVGPYLTSAQRPRRSVYLIRQVVRTFVYVCYAILLFSLAVIWTIIVTSVLPIICVKRGYRKVPEYYGPAFKVQREVYCAYQEGMHQDWLAWDFERGQPQPISLQQRGFKSDEGIVRTQNASSPLLRLPPELRLQIYREVIVGNSTCIKISTHRRRKHRSKRPMYKTQGEHITEAQFEGANLQQVPAYDCGCFGHNTVRMGDIPCERASPLSPGRGILALSKTCKQVYMETIDLLYSLPVFRFDFLNHPPYFLQRVLPQRLALIKHIRICFSTPYMGTRCAGPRAMYDDTTDLEHRLHRCARCNIHSWLHMLQTTMHGLERIDVIMHIDTAMPTPSLDEPWLRSTFNLQRRANRLSKLRIYVYPINTMWVFPSRVTFIRQYQRSEEIEQFDEMLQAKIKKDAETFEWISDPKTIDQTPEGPS